MNIEIKHIVQKLIDGKISRDKALDCIILCYKLEEYRPCPECIGEGFTIEADLECCRLFNPNGTCCREPEINPIQVKCTKCEEGLIKNN